MFSYIRGELASVEADNITVDNNGIGFRIFVPATVVSSMPSVGSEVKIHTYFHVKEDAMQLFGFLTKDDLSVFKLLITVSGIGPKGALAILSTLSADDLRFAVLAGDSKAISKAPGVGNKTAQRLIIELKDKLKIEDVFENDAKTTNVASNAGAKNDDNRTQAVQVLVALGYSQSESFKAVNKVPGDELSVDDIIGYVLKNIF